MLIDWFTIIAQALNFLILVWLMKRFLYKPILHAIDERESRIAAELADAAKKKIEAQKESDDYKQKNKEFDEQRAGLLNRATEDARNERERLLSEARKAAAALSLKQQETLKSEEQHLHQAIIGRIQKEVFTLTRKALTDLAGTSLEEAMVGAFVRRLKELSETERGLIASAFKASSSPAIVRTPFSLPPALHDATERVIKETIGPETPIQFEIAQGLISGIELTTNGQKIAWSIADYLGSLEKGVTDILKEKVKPVPKVESNSEEPKHESGSQ